MGNEAGEWIIHGVTWDDPKCIHDVDEAVEYINRVGFLPLFKNEIPGFSLEERTVAEYWWSDDPVRDPWRWRIAIAKKHDVLYGKFFAKKAGFDRPIVHGLCSLGYACRMMIDALFPGEPERMVSIENQFRAVALPGDHFTLHVWKTGENEALFRMVKDSDGKAILDYGRMTWK